MRCFVFLFGTEIRLSISVGFLLPPFRSLLDKAARATNLIFHAKHYFDKYTVNK
jgi:hypothetical protein